MNSLCASLLPFELVSLTLIGTPITRGSLFRSLADRSVARGRIAINIARIFLICYR